MRLFWLFISAASIGMGASFTIGTGVHHFGAGSGTISSPITVNLSGSGSGSGYVYFTMDGKLQISLPPGVSGTCSGSPCHTFSTDTQGAGRFHIGSSAFPTDNNNNSFAVDAVFSANSSGSSPVNVWDDASLLNYGGPLSVELGSKIYSETSGYVTGIRFNKPPTDSTSSHQVSLWDVNGNLLASTTSTSETASGWQSVLFTTPVPISANTIYVASYYTTGPFWYNTNVSRNREYGSSTLHASGYYVASNGSCNFSDNWPADAGGRPAAGFIGCFQLSNGSISSISNADATSSAFATEGCGCMYAGIGPGPFKFQDNYMSAVGLPWHHDDTGGNWATRGDYTYLRNTFHTPFERMYSHPASDGMRYFHRQPLEWKSGQRISLVGNIFDQSWVEDNPTATTITLTSVAGQGITDVNAESNTFRHVPGVMSVTQVVDGGASITKPPVRFRFANNLAYDVNGSMTYWVVAGGFSAPEGWMLDGPNGSEDIIVDHNTTVGNVGRLPSVLHLFDTPTDGVQVTNNILHLSSVGQGFTLEGAILGASCSGSGKVLADCLLTGGYKWDHNLLLGDSDQNTITSWWPNLANYIPSNPTDLNSAGWFSIANNDYHLKTNYCSGCGHSASDLRDVGADIDKLQAAQGAVKLIGVPSKLLTSTTASVTFVAPDAQGCPVDISATDATLINSFTRINDAGGVRNRSVSLTGLASKTVYYYRVNCAVEQPTGQFRTY